MKTKSFQDQLGTTHFFDAIPQKIISLVPSQTELLVDLGLEKNLVGITKFCVHPKHLLKSKTIIGGTKNVNFENMAALKPDIIIANKEENSEEIVQQLSEICPVWVTNIVTLEDNNQMILDFGILFEKENESEILVQKIQNATADYEIFMEDKPEKKVAYFIWAKPYMVAANLTFINQILKLNKFQNVFANQNRYPEIELESLKNKKLDLILLSSEPFPFKEKQLLEIKKHTNAKIIFADGEYFSWHGSRIFKAFDYFKTLHSDQV